VKTIAITIDEETLARVDRLSGREKGRRANRSRVIRHAIRRYVDQVERQTADQREDAIVRRHRERLTRQASALVRSQARP
jgi:metal-responsive CopG/Arc/MetJ family transcriptional regulator